MQLRTVLPLALPTLSLAAALTSAPAPPINTAATPSTNATTKPLPLIIWHGLGDRYDADGIASVAALAQQLHPGTYVYPIRLSPDGSTDSRSTFFGNMTTYLTSVCANLTSDPLLSSTNTRVDALGFSQGGQFLRGLLERCEGVRVRSLVTFGSQHNGIAKFQECGTWDLLCRGAMAAVKGNAWGEWVQGNIVPAQYYREVNESTGLGSEEYVLHSNFLADVNNEGETKNRVYRRRLAGLERFVMYVFEEDKTVLPKESGWFADVNATSLEVTELRNRTMYKEDWLGLRELDEKDALVFRTAPGAHMRLTDKVLTEAFNDFFGPERESWDGVPQSNEGGQQVLGLP
ncbi:Alpha/Beta hydrolase protein [Delphinella strobiligena]|nr:Alpha/Beta hydrolase protein [Delphinella strobiligena]